MSEPRTADQWLNIELHDAGPDYDGGPQFTCIKCKQTYPTYESSHCPASDLCVELAKAFLVPDRIKVDDWNTAMYWARKVHALRFHAALIRIFDIVRPDGDFQAWIMFGVTSNQWLIAAAIAVERSKE